MRRKINIEKTLFYVLLIGFIISIIPIFMLGTYSFPFYDDFNHGYLTYAAVNNGASFFDIVKVAYEHMLNIYNSWQGTYTTIFLSALHPGIFGEEWYFLTPIIILLTQIFGTVYLAKVIFKDYLHLNNYRVGIIVIFILFFQIQNLPSAFESYYWWASGIMHTFSYNMLLFFCALLLSIIKKNNIFKFILLALLAFVIGGGAYEIALFTSCLALIVLIGYLVFNKINNKTNNKLIIIEIGIVFLVSLIGLFINISAPGNAIRIENSGIHVSPILAIIESFIYSIVHTFEYISLKTVIVAFMIVFLSFEYINKLHVKVINPLLFILISWCGYSIIFTPAIYGENYVAAPRYLNVLYFAFYWFLIVDVLYITYYYKKQLNKTYLNIKRLIDGNKIGFIVTTVLISICAIFQFSYLDATGSSAMLDILLGNASSFKAINEERLAILEDQEVSEAILPKMVNKVRLFESDDLTDDSESYFNEMYAKYYGKEKVIVINEK